MRTHSQSRIRSRRATRSRSCTGSPRPRARTSRRCSRVWARIRPASRCYFDCCARGAGFFGVPGLESAYLEQALGGVPLAGMFGSCELGPIAGRAELLTYTGVLALLDRYDRSEIKNLIPIYGT